MGGRICSMVAGDDGDPFRRSGSRCSAIRCIRRASRRRCGSSTSQRLTMPVLFASGTRDAFGTPAELKQSREEDQGTGDISLDRDRRSRVQAAESRAASRSRRARRAWREAVVGFVQGLPCGEVRDWRRASRPVVRVRRPLGLHVVRRRVRRRRVGRVLTLFRGAVRQVATDFGVRIAKWLGDGCMLVSVDAAQLVAAVCELEQLARRARAAAADARGHGRRRGDPARRRRLHRPVREPRGAALRPSPTARDPRARPSSRSTRPRERRSSRPG